MAEPFAVLSGAQRDQRRSSALWAVALAAVTVVYVAFHPAVGGPSCGPWWKRSPRTSPSCSATTGAAPLLATSPRRLVAERLLVLLATSAALVVVVVAVGGRRAIAVAVGTGAAVLGYPAGEPITDGVDTMRYGLLAVVIVVSAVVAVTTFDRRGVGT